MICSGGGGGGGGGGAPPPRRGGGRGGVELRLHVHELQQRLERRHGDQRQDHEHGVDAAVQPAAARGQRDQRREQQRRHGGDEHLERQDDFGPGGHVTSASGRRGRGS